MKKIILLITLFLSIGLINGFAQEKEKPEETKEMIRVGVFLDLTGTTKVFGIPTMNGIKLAVNEINKAGGIDGKKIYLIIEDDQGRPEMAKTVVQKLISEHKVHAILGEVASTNSLAAAPEAQRAKIPMISPASTNPKVTQTGDYIFRACFVDSLQGDAMAQFALYSLGIRKIAILKNDASDYSKSLAETFAKSFTNSGGKITINHSYTYYDTDFKEHLLKIRSLKPDAIYIPAFYSEAGIIVKQARELKINVPILGSDDWDSPKIWEIGGNALENTYITNHFSTEDSSIRTNRFIEDYKNKFETEPDTLAALGYDAAYVLGEALRRAKTTDGEKLRDAIAQSNYDGITGKITFDESRNPRKPVAILKLRPDSSTFRYFTTIKP